MENKLTCIGTSWGKSDSGYIEPLARSRVASGSTTSISTGLPESSGAAESFGAVYARSTLRRAEATPEILTGEICFFKAGQSNPLAIVPYIARIHNLIDFSPGKLYFHKADGKFTAQLVLTSSQAPIDEELGLFWSDSEQVRSYEVEEAGVNMRIIDITTNKPAATQAFLLVKIGSLTRELPVDFTE